MKWSIKAQGKVQLALQVIKVIFIDAFYVHTLKDYLRTFLRDGILFLTLIIVHFLLLLFHCLSI